MKLIDEMLRRRVAPAIDGLYRVGAPPRSVEYDNAALSWFEVGPPLDFDPGELEELDSDDEFELDGVPRAATPDGGAVWGGEGSHGSEGFFAREDAAGNVVWAVVMAESNPFVTVSVDGQVATFVNNLGNAVTVRLDDPHFAGPA